MEFPRLVYRSASDHLLVETQEQYDRAMSDGWFGSVPEAQASKHLGVESSLPSQVGESKLILETLVGSSVPDDNAPPTRSELEQQARELNLAFDGRNSDATLLRMIDNALKA